MKSKKFVLGAVLLLLMASVASVAVVQATSTLQVTLVTSGNDGICSNGQGFAIGQATASGGTGPYTFSWVPDAEADGSLTANPNTAVLQGPPGNPQMCVTVTSADGQSKTVSKSVSITCGGGGF